LIRADLRAGEPGRFVLVNDDDDDQDGILDYDDGYNKDENPIFLGDDVTYEEDDFVMLKVKIAPTSINLDPNQAWVLIDYSADSPDPNVWSIGRIRLWKKPGDEPRDRRSALTTGQGDWIEPGLYTDLKTLMPWDPNLQPDPGNPPASHEMTFYIEGVQASQALGDAKITFMLDPDGDGPAGYVHLDTVQVTVIALTASPGSGPVGTRIDFEASPTGLGIFDGSEAISFRGTFEPTGYCKTCEFTSEHQAHFDSAYPDRVSIILGEDTSSDICFLFNLGVIFRAPGVLRGDIAIETASIKCRIHGLAFSVTPSAAIGVLDGSTFLETSETDILHAETGEDVTNAPATYLHDARVLVPVNGINVKSDQLPDATTEVAIKSFSVFGFEQGSEALTLRLEPPGTLQSTLYTYLNTGAGRRRIIFVDNRSLEGVYSDRIAVYAPFPGKVRVVK